LKAKIMNIWESFLTASDSILANKMRAVLTMLGVIIGVAAVIALVSLGDGLNASITSDIQSIGTNLIFVTTDTENSNGRPALSLEDAEAIADPLNVPAVVDAAASVQGTQQVVFNGLEETATVLGVTANYFGINNITDLTYGDFLTEADIDGKGRVAVIGATVASELFGETYPVGQSLKINGVSYEVVGVLTEVGEDLTGSEDENVYIPISTAQSRLYTYRTRTGAKAVTMITAQAVNEDQMDTAVEQITLLLRDLHDITYAGDDDFTIINQADLLSTLDSITGTLTAFLAAIAGVSLLVGGIGIMNIMLVSVTERTREIGVRKAIGALRRDIIAQFLLEAILLCLLGGVLGILLGFGLSGIAGGLLDITAVITANTIVMAVGFAVAVGVIFGAYPAWRAAGLSPIEALRYE
jgi:putative ABC transport system permease protein